MSLKCDYTTSCSIKLQYELKITQYVTTDYSLKITKFNLFSDSPFFYLRSSLKTVSAELRFFYLRSGSGKVRFTAVLSSVHPKFNEMRVQINRIFEGIMCVIVGEID